MKNQKLILIMVLVGIGGLIWYFEAQKPNIGPGGDATHIEKMGKEEKAKMYDPAIELVGNQRFINTEPFALRDYIGEKVILVDFWTYSCINCQRTTPYLNAWWDKYKDQGLLIVGVHTPEFEFEKNYNNLLIAVQNFGIEYPVVQDNNYATWRAYGNRYWPRKYLIDIDGFIVYDHIGEGRYDETEMKIQELLSERKEVLSEEGKVDSGLVRVDAKTSQALSPETYFGSSRNNNFGNGRQGVSGYQKLEAPENIEGNTLYLDGEWRIFGEYATNDRGGNRIIFKYNAKEVYFVASSDKGVNITVLQDGKPLGRSAGEDISRDDSTGFIKESRLYKLVENSDTESHTLEIIIENPGIKAFTFTFG